MGACKPSCKLNNNSNRPNKYNNNKYNSNNNNNSKLINNKHNSCRPNNPTCSLLLLLHNNNMLFISNNNRVAMFTLIIFSLLTRQSPSLLCHNILPQTIFFPLLAQLSHLNPSLSSLLNSNNNHFLILIFKYNCIDVPNVFMLL